MDDTRPAQLTVRTADPGDLPELDRWLPSGRNDVHRGFLARQAAGDAAYLVARRDGVPVGTGVVRWRGRGELSDPEITNLQVEPAVRSLGVGTALVRYAEELVRARGHARVVIGVDGTNTRAAALYRRLGYTDTGVRWTGTYTWYDDAGTGHQETEHVQVLALTLARPPGACGR